MNNLFRITIVFFLFCIISLFSYSNITQARPGGSLNV